jgi:hypothetical protein
MKGSGKTRVLLFVHVDDCLIVGEQRQRIAQKNLLNIFKSGIWGKQRFLGQSKMDVHS